MQNNSFEKLVVGALFFILTSTGFLFRAEYAGALPPRRCRRASALPAAAAGRLPPAEPRGFALRKIGKFC